MKVEIKKTEEYVKIDGKDIFCRWIKPSIPSQNKPVIIFLHEGLGSVGQWKDFPEEIVKNIGHTALIYDRYGYGKSSPLQEEREKNYLHKEALELLPELIDHYQLNNIILFGHSDGGSISLIHAAAFPERVKAVITEAAHAFVEEFSTRSIAQTKKLYEKGDKLKEALRKYHGDKTHSMFYGWANTRLTPDFKNWNITPLLSKIKAPVLAIQGEDDEYGTKDQLRTILREIPKAKSLTIANCKHTPHHQQREKVISGVKNFVGINT